MNLQDTVDLMTSSNYKDRFKAEYCQTKTRLEKLKDLLKKWDNGTLDFTPSCPRQLLAEQAEHMQKYLDILEARAKIEEVSIQ